MEEGKTLLDTKGKLAGLPVSRLFLIVPTAFGHVQHPETFISGLRIMVYI
jgi:hypothetical protein